jgi:hypothetical protein
VIIGTTARKSRQACLISSAAVSRTTIRVSDIRGRDSFSRNALPFLRREDGNVHGNVPRPSVVVARACAYLQTPVSAVAARRGAALTFASGSAGPHAARRSRSKPLPPRASLTTACPARRAR